MIEDLDNPDKRPAKGGWAPGNYMCPCYKCGAHFTGDKRASTCAPCAYKKVNVFWRILFRTALGRFIARWFL